MRRLLYLVGFGALSTGAVMIAGCPEGGVDTCQGAACGVADGSTTDGWPTCDPSKDPSCVSDGSGIFVNGTSGSDGAAGTKEAPLKTIGAALTKATGSKSSVYICAGTYAEHVKITSAVNLYGGFACADWTYAATNKPKIAPSDAGYALDVESVASAISIADLEFDSIDATKPGDSSIAVFAIASNVAFTRDTLSAGAGVAGASGTLTTLTFPDQSVLNGNNASGATPGAQNLVACPGDAGITVGGSGGGSGFPGDAGTPPQPGSDAGAGGMGINCGMGGTGNDGASVTSTVNGTGAATSGSLDAAGWKSSTGGDGLIGRPGQGGGGGAGFTGFGAGGGGAGACSGAGGGGGTGGGASITLVANASTLAMTSCTMTTKDAGAGGAGVAGQPGQAPGGFHGNGAGAACNGGNGGAGGSGGAGGGGAGGISVGVLYKGSAPTIDSATQNAITVASGGGAKGAGGIPGTNDGIAGVAQPTLEVK